jgi:UDPglucose--hexose-1-phosphate uridylyltransferase
MVKGTKRLMSGVGIHEVLIETPLHNMTTALLPVEQIRSIIETYQVRSLAAYQDSCVEHVVIFKNHGEGAGTSLEHPHSQLIATPIVPGQVRSRREEAIRYFDDTGECVFCQILREEMEDGIRIIWEGKSFVAFVPYAALSAFHTWIFPKRHAASFGSITPEEIDDLANTLKTVLAKFYYGLNNPDFNYVIRSLPLEEDEEEWGHWYLSIVPRLSKTAGFELGSGMFINTALPEESAKFLRETKVPF